MLFVIRSPLEIVSANYNRFDIMIRGISKYSFKKIVGLLVLLSYAISDFTLAAYQRHSL